MTYEFLCSMNNRNKEYLYNNCITQNDIDILTFKIVKKNNMYMITSINGDVSHVVSKINDLISFYNISSENGTEYPYYIENIDILNIKELKYEISLEFFQLLVNIAKIRPTIKVKVIEEVDIEKFESRLVLTGGERILHSGYTIAVCHKGNCLYVLCNNEIYFPTYVRIKWQNTFGVKPYCIKG